MTPDTKKAPAVLTHRPGKPNERDFCIPVETIVPQSAPKSTKKRSTRWKSLERCAARKLGGERIVRQDFFESSPDVLVPDFRIICECKAYRKFAHHTILEQAQKKYCHDGENMVLVTKHQGQHGEYATVSLDLLADLLNDLREAQKFRQKYAAQIAALGVNGGAP